MSEGGEARMRQRWWMSNDRRDEGGEARNHGAEVEAVARAILGPLTAVSRGDDPGAVAERAAEAAIAAFDAVRRSPQGDRERPAGEGGSRMSSWSDLCDVEERSPQSEDHRFPAAHPNIRTGEGETFAERARRLARPPQGENHEAGIQAALNAYHAKQPHETIRTAMERAIAAYLSRCPSPERNTEKERALREYNDRLRFDLERMEARAKAAERDTEKLVEAAQAVVTEALAGTLTHRKLEPLVDALAEFTATPEKRVSRDHDPGRDD